MALPASGEISMSMVNVELGYPSSQNVSLNDTPVRNLFAKPSGTISLSDGYGKTGNFIFNQTISADTTNYNLRSAAIAAGWNGTSPLIATITINSGIYVSANTTSTWAFDTGASFPAGSSLSLINNGFIVGMGGAGGGNGDVTLNGAGYPGGPALRAQQAISITNNGTIGGGGGGGGVGQQVYIIILKGGTGFTAAGGGGGGGRSGRTNSAGGARGGDGGQYTPYSQNGAPGTVSGGGVGGNGVTASGTSHSGTSGKGGNGATWGSTGAQGGAATGSSGVSYGNIMSGGAGGAAVNGNSFITWVATGTRLGSINA